MDERKTNQSDKLKKKKVHKEIKFNVHGMFKECFYLCISSGSSPALQLFCGLALLLLLVGGNGGFRSISG